MRASFAAALSFAAVGFGLAGLNIACHDTATAPLVPDHLGFVIQPATTVAGAPFAPAVVVAVLDADGRTVTSPSKFIRLEIVGGSTNATLLGVTSAATADGKATFSDLSIIKSGVGYSLLATSSGLFSAVTSPFDVSPAAPNKLVFRTQPTKTSVGSTLVPALIVEVRDAFENTVTSATNAISIAISAGGSLSGATTVAAVNGVATFSDLSVNTDGVGYTLIASAGSLVAATSAAFDIRPQLVFSMLSAGYFHACGLSNGAGYCWGDWSEGQRGGGTDIWPEIVSGGLTFTQISAGRSHSCGLTAGGIGYCWGSNTLGQLGIGTQPNTAAPTAVLGGHTYATLTAGYSHTCGVTTAGAGYCWGDNSAGELADATIARSNVPVPVPGGLTFSTLSPGRLFTCGLTTANVGYCWGENSGGELGDGTTAQRTSPVAVSGQLTFATLGAGGFHACGLTTAGAAYCWGDGGFGQLGNGSHTASAVPVGVVGGQTFASISVGNRHTCAVTTSGVAYCWGDNSTGLLGNGSTNESTIPVAVNGGLTFAKVTAGRFHTCGVTTTGAGYCWGQNSQGLLGDGTTVNSLVPVRIR